MILTSLVPSKDAEALHDAAEGLETCFWEGEKEVEYLGLLLLLPWAQTQDTSSLQK